MKEYPSADMPRPRPSSASAKSSLSCSSHRLRCMCSPFPVRWEKGLGMKVASIPASAASEWTM